MSMVLSHNLTIVNNISDILFNVNATFIVPHCMNRGKTNEHGTWMLYIVVFLSSCLR